MYVCCIYLFISVYILSIKHDNVAIVISARKFINMEFSNIIKTRINVQRATLFISLWVKGEISPCFVV